MADSTEGDTEVQDLGVLVSVLIALIAGLVIHSFIMGVNVSDWWKGRSVTPVDLIVTSLCITRMCAQCDSFLYLSVDTFFLSNQNSHVTLTIVGTAYYFFTYGNIWLTSLLSIVFCLKISNLQTRLFLYLKRVVVQRTGYFILASILLSAFCCLMFLFITITGGTKGGTRNATMDDVLTDCTYNYSIYIYTIGAAFIPLLFCCTSSIFLFISLYYHTSRMKMSSNLSINLETYYSVMRFVSFTFIYNTMFFVVDFVSVFYFCFYCVTLPWLYTALGFLPVLHSSYLIYRTAKLRNQMSKVLQNVIDSLFQRKEAESRENIEVVNQ